MVFSEFVRHRASFLRSVIGLLTLGTVSSCANMQANVAEGPVANATANRHRLPRGRATPFVTISAAPSRVDAAGVAIYSIRSSRVNRRRAIWINYAVGGTATMGKDYTLTGPSGQVAIRAGASSSNVTLHALPNNLSTGDQVATMILQPGNGYNLSSSNKAAVTIVNPTPTPTPTPTPNPTAAPSPISAQEIWIAVRTDNVDGTGTQIDPYDGSTMDKFDVIMADRSKTPPYTTIHLGPGTFRTAASDHNKWQVKSGWVVEGAGMYSTTVQMGGSVAGIHYDLEAFKSDCCSSADNVIIRDLTVDCNWAELQATATDNKNVGEKNISVSAIEIFGSNNLIERVRHINTYGSAANGQEEFGVSLCPPSNMDGAGNRISYCRGELPAGNYGSAFNIGGPSNFSPIRYVINSKIDHCTVIGINNGLLTAGFTNGLGGSAFAKNFEMSDNFVSDCAGVFYCDTGSLENIQITNNTVVRGWLGIGLVADGPNESWTKKNIQISGNKINVQNRAGGAPSDAIRIQGASTTTCTIDSNTITFDMNATGYPGFHTILAQRISNLTISNNTIGSPASPGYTDVKFLSCTSVTTFGNKSTSGGPVPGL